MTETVLEFVLVTYRNVGLLKVDELLVVDTMELVVVDCTALVVVDELGEVVDLDVEVRIEVADEVCVVEEEELEEIRDKLDVIK